MKVVCEASVQDMSQEHECGFAEWMGWRKTGAPVLALSRTIHITLGDLLKLCKLQSSHL